MPNTSNRTALLVFARAPVAGKVKSRLRRAWGARGACFWYRRLLATTVATAVRSRVAPVELCCAPGTGHPVLRRLAARHDIALTSQPPGDLGERMWQASRRALRHADAVVIIGADCTPLTPSYLRAAVAALEAGNELVVGPATDGGYVLIGLRRPVAGLFRGVDWGSERVLQQTRVRARRAGLHMVELPPSWDVDRPRDMRRLLRQGRLQRWGPVA